MVRGGKEQCKREAPASVRYCCKHAQAALLPLIEGQGFLCGYKGCTGTSKEQGTRCDKCLQLEKSAKEADRDAGASSSAAPVATVEHADVVARGTPPTTGEGSGEPRPAAPGVPVERAACEHCTRNPADDGLRYCKGCFEKLEKALGFTDEDAEKTEDVAGTGLRYCEECNGWL
jgi:hypothetical protein